jgi:hypothetical protein
MMKLEKKQKLKQEHLLSKKSLLQTRPTMLKGWILWKAMPLGREIRVKSALSDR